MVRATRIDSLDIPFTTPKKTDHPDLPVEGFEIGIRSALHVELAGRNSQRAEREGCNWYLVFVLSMMFLNGPVSALHTNFIKFLHEIEAWNSRT